VCAESAQEHVYTVQLGPMVPYLVSLPDAARLFKLLILVHKGLSNMVDTLFLLSLPFFNPFCVC
jgi:hypothetical protein